VFSHVSKYLDGVFSHLKRVRGPILVSTIIFMAFSLPGQTLEVYRVLAQDLVSGEGLGFLRRGGQIGFAFLALIALSVFSWQITREVCLLVQDKRGATPSSGDALAAWTPRLLATVPFLGVALGLWFARADLIHAEIATGAAPSLIIGMAIAVLLACLMAWPTTTDWLSARLRKAHVEKQLFRRPARLIVYAAVALAILGFTAKPVELPQLVGAIPIVCLFFLILEYFVALLTSIYDRFSLPLLSVLAFLAVLFSAFDWNDNHEIRFLDDTKRRAKISNLVNHPLDKVFAEWLRNRKDLDYFQTNDKSYYVYVISAEGGGLYAAYRTAHFLARMQDICPGFAQHIFAIVGVSGGSVGSAVFSALARDLAENREWRPCALTGLMNREPDRSRGEFEKLTDTALSKDFLSPLVWGSLFPDFLQRFLPVGIGAFDRALALERGLEAAWAEVLTQKQGGKTATNAFEQSFYDLWNPSGSAPALLLTTTDVEQGSRIVVRPFQHRWGSIEKLDSPLELGFDEVTGGFFLDRLEPRLSTAVAISARFPYVTPAGTITRPQRMPPRIDHLTQAEWVKMRKKVRLVDGGYYENSGVETAARLVMGLQQIDTSGDAKGRRIVVRLIALSTMGEYFLQQASFAQKTEWFGEFTSPFAALLNTRHARGHSALMTALAEMNRRPVPNVPEKSDLALWAPLSSLHFRVPLGWQLSDVSRTYIRNHFRDPTTCKADFGRLDDWNASLNINACTIGVIVDDLMPMLTR
jgi:hypothetical protein